jgi:hypothetical protein
MDDGLGRASRRFVAQNVAVDNTPIVGYKIIFSVRF